MMANIGLCHLLQDDNIDRLMKYGSQLDVPNLNSLKSILDTSTVDILQISTAITDIWRNESPAAVDNGSLDIAVRTMSNALFACWKKRTDDMIYSSLRSVTTYDQYGLGFTWPCGTPPEAMDIYIVSVGVIVPHTDVSTVVRFVATLDQMIGATVTERYLNACILYSDMNYMDKKHQILDISLAFVQHMIPSDFNVDCYLSRMSHKDMVDYISSLRTALRIAFLVSKSIRSTVQHDNVIEPRINELSWRYDPAHLDLDENLNSTQRLLEFLLNVSKNQLLRHEHAVIYRPVHTDRGMSTYFYKTDGDMTEFVCRSVVPRSSYPEMYDAITVKPGIVKYVSELLCTLPDPRLPIHVSNRTLFSFNNGIFCAKTGTFYTYTTHLGMPNISELGSQSLCTANYFNIYLPHSYVTGTIEDIPTPNFDHILQAQKYDEKDMFWFHAMMGRTIHDVGSMDDWQVCLYVKGVAGSGKSTIFRLWAEIYPAEHVGFLSDDSEMTFCDQHLIDSYIVCCLDVSREFRLATTRFNSYVSGETVIINRKFKTAIPKKWNAPIIFASNENPPMKSRAGSGARRILIFLFEQLVKNSDPALMFKCRAELPFFMIKCARRYLKAVQQYGNKNIWEANILPQQCHRGREEYICSSSSISAFFCSGLLVYNYESAITLNALNRAYQRFTETNRFKENISLTLVSIAGDIQQHESVFFHPYGPYNAIHNPDPSLYIIPLLDSTLKPEDPCSSRFYGMALKRHDDF